MAETMEAKGYPGADEYCDLDNLLSDLRHNQTARQNLIEMFLENSPILRTRMRDALAAGDRCSLAHALHDIRSTCALFSGNRCVAVARRFEKIVRSGPEDGATDQDWPLLADEMADTLERMTEVLRSYLEEVRRSADSPG